MKNFVHSIGTYLRGENTTRKMMNRVFIALIPIIIFAFIKNGLLPFVNNKLTFYGMIFPLIFIFIPAITSFIVELLYGIIFLKKRKKDIIHYMTSTYSILPGLFVGLVLPINTPISILIFGAIIATVLGKLIFGGFGNNIFNPALIGVLFVVSAYSLTIQNAGGYMTSYELDTISGATPLSTVVEGIGSYESLVKPFGFFNLFFGFIPGAMGEISSLLILVAFIYLTATKTIKWRIPTFYVSTVFIMTFIIGYTNGLGIWYPFFQILTGGLLFGAVFMATDPVTSPTTKTGQVIHGICLGVLTVLFRYLTPYPEGVMTSILTMNLLVFLIDKIGVKAKKSFKIAIIPITIILIISGVISYLIGISFKTTNEVDPNYNIVSKEINNNKTTYVVTQKGFSSLIKIEIVFTNNKITSATILEQNDSYFDKVLDSNLIDNLVKNYDDINSVDSVSGATISSNALKKAFENTIKDFKSNSDVKEPETVNDFNKVENGDNTIYTIIEKSFGGYMTLEIETNLKKITRIEIKEATDTYLNLVEEDSFIDRIIVNQSNIQYVDSVSGATVSSNAIRSAVMRVIEDMGDNNE